METETPKPHQFRRTGAKLGLLAVGAVAGTALAWSVSANAATPTGTSSTGSSSSSPSAPSGANANFPAHGSAAHESAEKPVTGTDADKAKAAAIKAAGGGTAGDVTTDMSGKGFEVSVTNNGTTTEYHLDSTFAVMKGGPGGGAEGPAGPPQGQPPAGAASGTSAE